MQQTEQDYIRTLRNRLTGHVSQEDLDEILSDYAEHFSIGKAEGAARKISARHSALRKTWPGRSLPHIW